MTKDEPRQPDSKVFDTATIHLLNNHLGVILGFVDLVLDETPEGDPRRRDLLEIKQAAAAAVALVGPVCRPT
jgi:hypothetical protein